ncbi:MAG: hypothetical protein WKF47_07875 [Geodermatophilaceae bacterium]
MEDGADSDDDQAEDQVRAETLSPGPGRAAGGDDVPDDADDQEQDQRVRGAAGGGGHAEGPQPPREWV